MLSAFEGDDERKFAASCDMAAEAVKMVLSAGMDRAMNKYNTRPAEEASETTINEWGFILKKYEAVFILDIRKTDDEGAAFSKEFGELIESLGGKMESVTPMGRKQFTYEIDKRRAGLYFDFVFELAAAKVKEIKEKYKLDQRILRNMIITYDRPADANDNKLIDW